MILKKKTFKTLFHNLKKKKKRGEKKKTTKKWKVSTSNVKQSNKSERTRPEDRFYIRQVAIQQSFASHSIQCRKINWSKCPAGNKTEIVVVFIVFFILHLDTFFFNLFFLHSCFLETLHPPYLLINADLQYCLQYIYSYIFYI